MTLADYRTDDGVDVDLDAELARRLLWMLRRFDAATGVRQRILSGRRSTEHQARLFVRSYTTTRIPGAPSKLWRDQRWWKLPGRAEVAVPGTSRHERGLAVDLALPAPGPDRDGRIAMLAPFLAEAGLTNRRVPGEPWHVELLAGHPGPIDDSPPPLRVLPRRHNVHELVFDIDRNRWFLSGPAGLVQVVQPATLALYRDGLTVNGARLAEPLPQVVHKQAVFDAVCDPRILHGLAV